MLRSSTRTSKAETSKISIMTATIAVAVLALGFPQTKAPQSSAWKRWEMKPLFMSAICQSKPVAIPFVIREGGENLKVNRWLKWESGSIAVLYGYSENKSDNVNLTNAAEGAINGLSTSKGLKLISKNQKGMTLSGMVGLKIYAVYDSGGTKVVYSAIMIAKGKKMWQCVATYEATPQNQAVAEKTFASVVIKP